MAVSIVGAVSGVSADVAANTRALLSSLRQLDYGSGGTFQLTSKSGTMAAGLAGASPIYAFRNSSASLLIALHGVKISAWSLGTGFAAGLGTFDMFVARTWTAADTGGTTDTISGNNGKLRASMASITALAEIRRSSTATLSAGTRTLDAQALESLNVNVTTATNTAFVPAPTKFFEQRPGEHPLVLAQNEGFVIQATVPATGTWTFAITPVWTELTSY